MLRYLLFSLFVALKILLFPVELFAIYVLKRHRLEKIKTVALGAPLRDAYDEYGDPENVEESDKLADAKVYTFDIPPYHSAWITADEAGDVLAATYISEKPDPDRDLLFMFDQYGEGKGWSEVQPGFMYWRNDEKVILACSALPVIGVHLAAAKRKDEGGDAPECDPNQPNTRMLTEP